MNKICAGNRRLRLNVLSCSFDHIQRIFTYCDSFGFHREPSSDCDLFVMSSDLDCLLSGKQRLVDVAQAACPFLFTTTVLSTSLGKTFFAWRFILNENILFLLTISYQKPFVFSVSVFRFQICTQKLNLSPKISLTYAICIVK